MTALTKWRLNDSLTLSEFNVVLSELYYGAKKNIELSSDMSSFLYELYNTFETTGEHNLTLHFSKTSNKLPCVCLEKNPRGNCSAIFKINDSEVYLYD